MKVSYAQAAMTTGLTGGALRMGIEIRLTNRFYKENPSRSRDITVASGLMLLALLLAVIALWLFEMLGKVLLPTFDLSQTVSLFSVAGGFAAFFSFSVLAFVEGLTSLKMFIETGEALRLYHVKHRDEEIEL